MNSRHNFPLVRLLPLALALLLVPCCTTAGSTMAAADLQTALDADSSTAEARSQVLGRQQLWLHTQGNRILRADGSVWMARGVNVFDPRNCGNCNGQPQTAAEVARRIDVAIADWGASLIRLDLTGYSQAYAARHRLVHWQSVAQDPTYLAEIKLIVAALTRHAGVYVLLSLQADASYGDPDQTSSHNYPDGNTTAPLTTLVRTFATNPQVLFAVASEPHGVYQADPSQAAAEDSQVFVGMQQNVTAMRAVEDAMHVPHHLITVQGTRGWARYLNYYIDHPIAGDNIVYEAHIYDPVANFDAEIRRPAASLPMIIGEFGLYPGLMTAADSAALMTLADELNVPYIAWVFAASCGVSTLLLPSGNLCGSGGAIIPSPWGLQVRNHLLQAASKPALNPPATTPTPTPTQPSPETAADNIRSLEDPSWCMDVLHSSKEPGTAVTAHPCNGSQAQAWHFSDGALQARGNCLSAEQAHKGAPLSMAACDMGNLQRWRRTGPYITLGGTNLCVGIRHGTLVDRSQLILWTCHGSINQMWQ